MKILMRTSALALTGALLIACGNKEQTGVPRQSGDGLAQLQPVIFDSAKNEYRVVGEKVGTAWGSGKAIQEREDEVHV